MWVCVCVCLRFEKLIAQMLFVVCAYACVIVSLAKLCERVDMNLQSHTKETLFEND